MVVVVARRWGIGPMSPPLDRRPPNRPGEPADAALQSARDDEIDALPADPIAARAFVEVLFARHHAEIYAYLVRMIRDPELAADLAQDAFVRAYRAHASLDDPTKARAWLYQIANRVALDEIRRRKIVRFIPWSGESRGAAPSAERLAMDTRFSAELERALARIPERQRSALLLAEVHDLTGIELAAALGTSHVAARALLTRARESLRRAMAEERVRAADAEAAGRPLDRPAAGGTRLDGRR
jgi:RNA polymerase sigma-70 factor (ECF subfamily)